MRKIDSSRQQSNNPTLASIALLSACQAVRSALFVLAID
jgi:hypothetical protein